MSKMVLLPGSHCNAAFLLAEKFMMTGQYFW